MGHGLRGLLLHQPDFLTLPLSPADLLFPRLGYCLTLSVWNGDGCSGLRLEVLPRRPDVAVSVW